MFPFVLNKKIYLWYAHTLFRYFLKNIVVHGRVSSPQPVIPNDY